MKNNNPTVSVIIALYNEEKYISEAINSILSQTYSDFELLIVDDGSTDSSGRIADDFARNDSRIKVFHTSNKGVSAARNIGINNAVGEWIMCLDGDDTYNLDAIEILLKHSDGVDMVCGTIKTFPSESKYREINEIICFDNIKDISSDFKLYYEQRLFLRCVTAKLYRRNKLTVPWDEDIPDIPDELFNIKNSLNFTGFRIIPDVVYNYRIDHAITLSTHFWTGLLRTREQILRMYWNIFPDNHEIQEIILVEHLSQIGEWINDLRKIDSVPMFTKGVILEEELNYVLERLPEYDYESLPPYAKDVWEIIRSCDNTAILDAIDQHYKKYGHSF